MAQSTPSIGPTLKHMYLLYAKIVDKYMQQHDLTFSQSDLLCQLGKRDGQSQAELCERLGIAAPTLSTSADALEKKGFIERRASEHDARQKRLFLTAKGRHIIPAVLSINDEIQQHITKNLSTAEQALMAEWIHAMFTQLQNWENER